ncbi:hypothetical protein [Niallia taxi]|uniref:hypothetical protein n=1 Tax=Niallia taxi TaxID=2499688 RepID=UPI00300939F0
MKVQPITYHLLDKSVSEAIGQHIVVRGYTNTTESLRLERVLDVMNEHGYDLIQYGKPPCASWLSKEEEFIFKKN